jgi:bifunctional UDP-N-acetylglucosamine pyrophosphorylase/glucosamine-1-phosphate N-acetyltransferase
MIGLFEASDTQNFYFRFRGKESYFWKRKIFQDLECLDPDNPDADADKRFDFLILFNPDIFLEIESEGVDEIITHIKHIMNLSTLEGSPFFAIPVESFKKSGLSLRDVDIYSRLKENKNINMIHLESRCKTLELKRDFRRIERFIITLQVRELAKNRVIVEDYNNFYIEGLVPIGEGTRISTGVVIKGTSKIGSHVTLYPNAYIENSTIGDNCVVLPGSIVRDSTLENDVQIGPYTHLRNGALVKEGAKMGNFVEMKKSTLGKGSKSMHLTYLGDAEVGEKVNIGAGTITCNYDGVTKNKTIIEDNVFIGSGTELVAPVVIRKNSYVGAGSTITEEVPENSLGIARQRQQNKVDWVKQKRDRVKRKKDDM